MAADEALLAAAANGSAALRFYEWTEPTLSLGYFQAARLRVDYPHLSSLAWLRRPTGGGAIVHDRELTYALATPLDRQWLIAGESAGAMFHVLLADALAEWEVVVRSATTEAGRGAFLCFRHHTPGDLVIAQAKVVGSAQRKRRGALLQHGSVLLASSSATPELPGITELTGRQINPLDLAASVVAQLTRRSGWRLAVDDWCDDERRQIEDLAATRYRTPEWNEKR